MPRLVFSSSTRFLKFIFFILFFRESPCGAAWLGFALRLLRGAEREEGAALVPWWAPEGPGSGAEPGAQPAATGVTLCPARSR